MNRTDKTATELIADMERLQAELRSEQTTVFVCNCCGKVARAQTQTYDHPAMCNRSLTQVECLTEGCNNKYMTYTYRTGDNNEQLTDRYTPVTMDAGQVARFVEAIEFTAKSA